MTCRRTLELFRLCLFTQTEVHIIDLRIPVQVNEKLTLAILYHVVAWSLSDVIVN
jgi:hypothetical protein